MADLAGRRWGALAQPDGFLGWAGLHLTEANQAPMGWVTLQHQKPEPSPGPFSRPIQIDEYLSLNLVNNVNNLFSTI